MAGRIAYYGGIVTDGLVLHLDAAKRDSYPGSGTVWRDLSGNGNNGTLVNGPTFDRDSGNGSLVFDGVDDYVDVQGLQNFINQDITISLWVNFTVLNGLTTYVFFHRPEKTTESLTYLYIYRNSFWDDGQLSFLCSYVTTGGTTSTLQHYQSPGFLNEGQWYNFTANYNSIGYSNFYVNGQLIVSRSPQPDFSRWVNVNESVMRTSINGFCPNLQIYNRALTPSEILQNYNAQKSRFGL